MIFFSPQGLGNSITNFPILNVLRQKRRVKVICFNNGSSSFFRTFHDEVESVDTSWQWLKSLVRLKDDSVYVTYPTWKKEIAAAILTSAPAKYVMKTPTSRVPSWMIHSHSVGKADRHHIENNADLLQTVDPNVKLDLNIRKALNLPSTMPTSAERVLGIHPTASNVFKYYPFEFWTRLLNLLKADYDKVHIFCGRSSNEAYFCKSLLDQLPEDLRSISQLHAGLGFQDLVKIMDTLTQFIGSDSALMHLSALMDKRVLALWSFANYKIIYPYGHHSTVYIPKETLHASIHEYPDQIPQYMKRASAETVAAIVRDQVSPNFQIEPRYKNPVRFFQY